MPSVIEDLIDGSTAGLGPDGFIATRVFLVSEIEGAASARTGVALTAPGIPARGEEHPAIARIYVDTITAEFAPGSASTARVTVSYRALKSDRKEPSSSEPAVISIGATVAQEQTTYDRLGILMTVEYDPQDGSPLPPPQPGTVTVDRSHMVFTYSRREKFEGLAEKVQKFVGKISIAGWLGSTEDGAWKCTRIEGQSDDGGETYNVFYEFQHDPNLWKAHVVYIDPATGQPPEKSNNPSGNGIAVYEVYENADFNELSLF